ncbi:paralemmin-1 isoform X2 [Cavia porcellus]|uniref:paralemmin-1 isoform X2 n=1 Tax=Cavia porcellus TaxID=10141 RepID=UPI002FDFF1A3
MPGIGQHQKLPVLSSRAVKKIKSKVARVFQRPASWDVRVGALAAGAKALWSGLSGWCQSHRGLRGRCSFSAALSAYIGPFTFCCPLGKVQLLPYPPQVNGQQLCSLGCDSLSLSAPRLGESPGTGLVPGPVCAKAEGPGESSFLKSREAPKASWETWWRWCRVLTADTAAQQERLQAIAERRKRQAEIESKRRQLEDDRRQLQHLKSKALRERWLLEGTPSSASEGDEDLRRQMQEDEQRARLLEESISRLEKEIDALENGEDNAATPSPARAPVPAPSTPAREEPKTEVVLNSQPTAAGTPKEQRVCNSPVCSVDGATMMKAAMYSVEITVEKDKVTGETRVLSSTTLLPREPHPQGIKVYEDETKVVHAVDGTLENGIQPLSSSEVDELIHKADEVTLSEAGSTAGAAAETRGSTVAATEEAVRTTPLRREITGVQAEPGEATSGPAGAQPGQESPVTMIFMGYQNVEDEAETKKVLGLQDTITAELVVIEDAAEAKEAAPPNGSAPEAPAGTPSPGEEDRAGPEATTSGDPQDLDLKKHRCRCCSVM